MELRPIPFIEDARYRIDREGRVFSVVTKRGRRRTTPEVRFEQLASLTLAEAIELARGLGSYLFELIHRCWPVDIKSHKRYFIPSCCKEVRKFSCCCCLS